MLLDPKLDPPAPVMGGSRWRRPFRHIFDIILQEEGFPSETKPPPAPEPGAVLAPLISSAPPPEARVGEQYAYQPRAHSADTSGFTWYFEKSVPGMAVDRHTGKVTWTPSEGGWAEVVLCARSLYGAASRQGWTICVRKAITVKKVVPNPRYAAAILRRELRKAPPFAAFWRAGRRRTDPSGRPAAPPGGRPRAALPLRE